MGWLTNKRNTCGCGIGANSKTGRKAYPLRKITGTKYFKPIDAKSWEPEHEYELLECGHLGKLLESVGSNLFSAQHAGKRRCRKCSIKN